MGAADRPASFTLSDRLAECRWLELPSGLMTATHPDVEAHLHKDEYVTPARVDAFANSDRGTQLAVLAVLTRRATDDSVGIQLSITVAALGLLQIFIPGRPLDEGLSWLAAIPLVALVAVTIALVMIAPSLSSLRQNSTRIRAHVWADAYQAELDRRWAQQTRAGRRWQAQRAGERSAR